MMEREREKKEGMVRVPMPLMYAPAMIRNRTSWREMFNVVKFYDKH